MAQIEPMDIDAIDSDFDNKENTFHHNNVLSRTPCTEKGYEELDVSELNMKLRYSITPASSPMTKSLTGPCLDNRNYNPAEDYLNNALGTENSNLTRSLNSTFNKNETITKSKVLPLQTLSADPFVDSNRNSSMRRLIDPDNNVTISVGVANEDENLSLPSTSSSVANTPEATTPTKEIPKPEGSPILRGLKSVLSMFRPSQSPIPPADNKIPQQDILSPEEPQLSLNSKPEGPVVLASTPVAANKQKESNSSRRSSPLKESVVFNDDLERELQWKDDSTIIFKEEKIPVHKLFFQHPVVSETIKNTGTEYLNTTVEYMDISCSESMADRTMTDIEHTVPVKIEGVVAIESDNEFLDCETTFTKNESCVSDYKETEIENKTKVIGNVTVDLSKDTEIKEKSELDCNNMSISENIMTAGMIDKLSVDQLSVSVTDVAVRPLVEQSSKIVEATTGMFVSGSHNEMTITDELRSQTQNASLQSEPLALSLNIQPEETNTERSIEDKIINNEENVLNVVNTNTSTTVDNKIDDLSLPVLTPQFKETSDEIKTMSGPEDHMSNIINLPDVCTVTSNHIEHVLLESPETKENIDEPASLNKDTEVCTINITGSCASHNVTKEMEAIDTIISMTKNEVHHTSQNLETNQVLQQDLNPDLLSSHNAIRAIVDSEIPTINVNKSLSELSSTIQISDMLVGNLSVTESYKTECDITTNAENTNFAMTLECDSKPNIANTETESKQVVDNNTVTAIHDNIDSVLLVNNVKPDIGTVVNLECHSDVIPTSHIELNPVLDNVLSEHDREVPELKIGNDMAITKSPSEIPLPDEDDIEQPPLSLTDPNNVLNSEVTIPQDVTFEKRDDNLIAHVDNANELIIETKDEQVNVTQNVTKEICDVSPQNITVDHNVEIAENISVNDHKDLNVIKTCSTNEINEDKICDVHTGNLTHSEINSTTVMSTLQNTTDNIQIENETFNVSNSVEIIATQQNTQEMLNIENVCEKINIQIDDEKIIKRDVHDAGVPSSVKDEVISAGLNTVKPEPINNIEDTNVNKVDENVQQEKEVQEIDEEIITSANNSPYVSVTDLALETGKTEDTLQNTDNPFATRTKIASSPPISPKIVSKGYNFNFDDIDDPFATKTNIRMSPTPESPNQSTAMLTKQVKKLDEVPKKVNNRRKSQPERKKSAQKKNLNSTFNNQLPTKENISDKNDVKQTTPIPMEASDNISSPSSALNVTDIKPENSTTIISQEVVPKENVTTDSCETATYLELTSTIQKEDIQQTHEEVKCLEQTPIISNEKSTSSSEQYFSLGTSGESVTFMNQSKNVFNLPEIDDLNFNPFATKSKMRMSPPPSVQNTNLIDHNRIEGPKSVFNTTSTDVVEGDRTFDKIPAKESRNINNTTCSSNNTNEEDTTVKEILTEDEDTIEGPFLEAEDIETTDKVTDVENESDMMNFDDIPQDKDENLENGELFIDADAFEFLLNQNKSATVLDSGKESLFLKFDPLFAKRVSSDGVLAALSKVQKRQSTPKKLIKPTQKDFTHIEKPGSSTEKDNNNAPVEEYTEDPSSTMTKPMMVVNPAMSSIVSPRRSATPPKLNRRSLTFTSPAMAVIDRLLSLSGNSSHLDHNTSIPHASREHTETDLAIIQLRELLAEKEIHVHNLRSESKELKERLAVLEVQVRNLESESSERLTKINDLNERLSEKTKINKSMAIVVEEYERTIASLIAETKQDKKRNAEERIRLIKERDEQTAHLTSMEVSFNDLHSKYEKSKQIILSCKANEDTYKKSIKEFEDNFSKMQNNYELLKQHATSKLNHANQELEKMNRAHEAEVLKLNAMIKRKDLHITSLEETLTQKTKANDELTAICDELINKVG